MSLGDETNHVGENIETWKGKKYKKKFKSMIQIQKSQR
jgi:hypothetical protein